MSLQQTELEVVAVDKGVVRFTSVDATVVRWQRVAQPSAPVRQPVQPGPAAT